MKTIKIAGVPEHFNMPWHLGINDGTFKKAGLLIDWIDVPEGSGKMCELLENKEVDIIIVLTEAIIKYFHQNPIGKIIQTYVKSPLNWGLYVAYNSLYKTLSELENQTFAISRMGSGSHLMSFVLADQQKWDLNKLQFEIVNNLDGAVNSLTKNKSQLFLWEQWTTKPLVEQKVFRQIGTLPTPWPCFVMAAHQDFIYNNKAIITNLCNSINLITREFKDIPSIEHTISNFFNLNITDVNLWLQSTEWSQSFLTKINFQKVQNYLLKLDLIKCKKTFNDLVIQTNHYQ